MGLHVLLEKRKETIKFTCLSGFLNLLVDHLWQDHLTEGFPKFL